MSIEWRILPTENCDYFAIYLSSILRKLDISVAVFVGDGGAEGAGIKVIKLIDEVFALLVCLYCNEPAESGGFVVPEIEGIKTVNALCAFVPTVIKGKFDRIKRHD